MKKLILTLALLTSFAIPSSAVDGKVLLVGIGIGLGIYTYQGTRNHVILPTIHAVQRTVRPTPQDKIDKQRNKAIKEARKRKERGQ